MAMIIRAATLAATFLALPVTTSAALPEIPFCPFGGAPGWFNRIFDDDRERYPPPWFYRQQWPLYAAPGHGTPSSHPEQANPPRFPPCTEK
jgi:hypothetical protein